MSSCLIKLAFLSPDLVEECFSGRHPAALSAKRLTVNMELPTLWSEQQSALLP